MIWKIAILAVLISGPAFADGVIATADILKLQILQVSRGRLRRLRSPATNDYNTLAATSGWLFAFQNSQRKQAGQTRKCGNSATRKLTMKSNIHRETTQVCPLALSKIKIPFPVAARRNERGFFNR